MYIYSLRLTSPDRSFLKWVCELHYGRGFETKLRIPRPGQWKLDRFDVAKS